MSCVRLTTTRIARSGPAGASFRALMLGAVLLAAFWACHSVVADQPQCDNAAPAEKQLLWGDLHVHTAWSLDAYAFGSLATPADAYAFARGQPLRLANGEIVQIDRPLDFVAVTDHAESFDVMYLCTDPLYRDDPYCSEMRERQRNREGRWIFNARLLPMLVPVTPRGAGVCAQDDVDCGAASIGQWRRKQEIANQANDPCNFTALIGYEWTATPGGRHWHRNVIFRSGSVPDEAFDYIRYPRADMLWRALSEHCKPDGGCDALAIPHNINWADGGGFDVAEEDLETLTLRARYERLAEMHQEKGSSECLPEHPDTTDDDCDFELLPINPAHAHLGGPEGTREEQWARMRSSYYRPLLGRGLLEFESREDALNPLKLGAIGSTDNHLGTPGRVAQEGYWGSMSMLWSTDEERLARDGFNPGGLVAVWAEENTRAAVFDALKRREAYATSGPRISLRFGITDGQGCNRPDVDFITPMGGTISSAEAPSFTVLAGRDQASLAEVHIIKGEVRAGKLRETVHRVGVFPEGRGSVCVTWQDDDFDPAAPAFWYTRVIELPTARWSGYVCERIGKCDEYPDADRKVAQRAWSSPIWHEPHVR